jgi:putative hydrolase of the HAD superfamily
MVTEIRAVGFDLDGTLFDHLGSAADGVDAFFRFLGVEPSKAARAVWFQAEESGYEKWRTGLVSFQEQRRYRLQIVLPAIGAAVPDRVEDLDGLFEEYLRSYQAAWRAFPDAPRSEGPSDRGSAAWDPDQWEQRAAGGQAPCHRRV